MYKRWEAPRETRQLRNWLKFIKKAKTWQLLIILILLSFVAATCLRINNLGMVERREAVLRADKEVNQQKVKQSLVELQSFVSNHMNTSMDRGIYLENMYNRDREQAIQASLSASNPYSEVYQKASIECRSRFQGGAESFRNDYVTCVESEVAKLPQTQQTQVYLPRAASYHYNFASPLISFDIAGIFTAISLLLAFFIFMRLILLYTLRFLVKKRTNHL